MKQGRQIVKKCNLNIFPFRKRIGYFYRNENASNLYLCHEECAFSSLLLHQGIYSYLSVFPMPILCVYCLTLKYPLLLNAILFFRENGSYLERMLARAPNRFIFLCTL